MAQLLAGAHVDVENMTRNRKLLTFCTPHTDMPRALVQKMWVEPELRILPSTLGTCMARVLRPPLEECYHQLTMTLKERHTAAPNP